MRVHFYRSRKQFRGQEGVIAMLVKTKNSKSIYVVTMMCG